MNPLHDWITGFVRLLLEVEAGARPARHLRPLLGAGLQSRQRLCPPSRGDMRHRLRGDTRVGRILVQATATRCEAVVLLHRPDRTTALTLTLVRDSIGWLVIDVGRPGDPVLAPNPPTDPPLTQVAWHTEAAEGPRPDWHVPAGWLRPAPQPAFEPAAA